MAVNEVQLYKSFRLYNMLVKSKFLQHYSLKVLLFNMILKSTKMVERILKQICGTSKDQYQIMIKNSIVILHYGQCNINFIAQ